MNVHVFFVLIHITRTHTHIFELIFLERLRYPREAFSSFAYIPDVMWTIQHLTVTLIFQDNWPHGLHDLKVIDHVIYMT